MEEKLESQFNEIYDKLYNSCKGKLDEVKKKNRDFLLKVALVLVVLNVAISFHPQFGASVSLTICCSVCILLFLMIIGNSNYRKAYKQNVIEGIVKGYNEKYYYDPKMGVMKTEYLISDFDRSFDEFYSEDRVFGRFENGENFQMSEVVTHTVTRTRDAEGHTHENKNETFRGLYGIVRMNKNIVSEIHIKSNSNFRKYSKNRLEMESAEFEKYYDCISMDKVSAMRVFTAELIEKYTELGRFYSNVIEVKIQDDKIFFRFRTNQLFEPPMFTSGLNKDLLKGYFSVIYFPIEVMKATIENINSVYE